MTPETLNEIERLARAATPGPWNHEPERYSAKNVIGVKPRDERWIANCQPEFNGYSNAEFIAALHPQAVMALVATIRKLRKALEWYGDTKNYRSITDGYKQFVVIEDADFEYQQTPDFPIKTAGKRAREALKEGQ